MHYALFLLVLLIPVAAQAQEKSFATVTQDIVKLVNDSVVPLFYALAFLLFIFGMVRFFFFGGEENREKGKTFMLWGIIGFVVMFSVWGIVRLLMTALPG